MVLNTFLHAEAILNVNQPIKKLKISNAQLQSVIIEAFKTQNWIVISEHNRTIRAIYRESDYMAQVKIKYAPTFYTINYADSDHMRYEGTSIHPRYNELIKALQINIVRNLKSENFDTISLTKSSPEVVQPKEPAVSHESIRYKLENIKKLYEDSLITEDEYDLKRKALIEAY